MIIAPSLLSCDFLNVQSELERLEKISDLWIHLDIMDGHFVPNMTFGPALIKNMHKVCKHPLDAHLMVTNPELYLELLKDSKIHNLTFHWESIIHHDRFISEAKKFYPSVGISLNPSTPIELIPEYIFSKIDLILLMSVNPGFGGQSYISEVEEKAKKLNKLRQEQKLSFQIQFDGGVSDKNAKNLASIGVDNLVSGSFIFSAKNNDYLSRIQSMRD